MKTNYVYPSTEIVYTDTPLQTLETKVTHQGITLREHFTGLAMQAILSNPEWMKEYKGDKYLMQKRVVAEVAISYADEVLKKLSYEEVTEQ